MAGEKDNLKILPQDLFYMEGIQWAVTLFCILTDTGKLGAGIWFSILSIIF